MRQRHRIIPAKWRFEASPIAVTIRNSEDRVVGFEPTGRTFESCRVDEGALNAALNAALAERAPRRRWPPHQFSPVTEWRGRRLQPVARWFESSQGFQLHKQAPVAQRQSRRLLIVGPGFRNSLGARHTAWFKFRTIAVLNQVRGQIGQQDRIRPARPRIDRPPSSWGAHSPR